MTEILTDAEFHELTRKIARDRGFSCANYKDRCLKRRIAVRMRARGVHTYTDYARMLDSDAGEYERLLEALTINVTRLFRNPEVFDAIAAEILPVLWRLPDGGIRIWSAGCASGEEPYSLAVLLHRFARSAARSPQEMARLSRFRVFGTDIDRPSLAAAAAGAYPEAAFADTPREIRDEYFSAGWPAVVRPDVRALVDLRPADLFGDDRLPAPFHLIVCRNVIIYFDRTSQERLFARFHNLLAPGGYLVLGKVETILGDARALFTPVNARERLFKKR
jgi:chemotaxis methyl-accepting protein methylase